MISVPKRVADRISKEVGRYQKVLEAARDRDINESDTVTIVTDVLANVFGYDKYSEITTEQAIRGTYCDLAIRVDDKIRFLIEVKAIGLSLNDNHLRQAINYGANEGIPFVVLTNGIQWQCHKIRFEQPISHELVTSFDLLDISGRKTEDRETLFLFSKEGLAKAAIEQFHERSQTVNRYMVAAIIESDPSLKLIRRELRRVTPGLKVTTEDIAALLPEVFKRDLGEGTQLTAARRRVTKAQK